MVPAGAGGREEVTEPLTAQGDHQVAQQQQEEAVAAPPRHLLWGRAVCSSETEGPCGRSAGGRAGAPELLEPERRTDSCSGGRGGAAPDATSVSPGQGRFLSGQPKAGLRNPRNGGSGPSLGGEGCGSRTRCWLGPNERAPEGEERKGSPGGRPSTPEPPGLIGFVSGPARSCQLSPGRGAGGRGGTVEGTPPALLQLLSSPP